MGFYFVYHPCAVKLLRPRTPFDLTEFLCNHCAPGGGKEAAFTCMRASSHCLCHVPPEYIKIPPVLRRNQFSSATSQSRFILNKAVLKDDLVPSKGMNKLFRLILRVSLNRDAATPIPFLFFCNGTDCKNYKSTLMFFYRN